MTDLRTATSRDGTTIAFDVRGSGPALVYVTGATCFRRFRPIVQDAKVFARTFTVYTYDHRGRGDSDDNLPWSVEREVDDLEAVIDAAGGSASVYGHSSGAVLALEGSLRRPDKIAKTVLYEAAYVHDAAEKADYERLGQQVGELLAAGDDGAALKTFLRGIGMPGALAALLPLVPGWRTMKALAPTVAYDLALTSDLPPLTQAQSITVPTRVLVGQKGPPGLHVVARQLASAIPTDEG